MALRVRFLVLGAIFVFAGMAVTLLVTVVPNQQLYEHLPDILSSLAVLAAILIVPLWFALDKWILAPLEKQSLATNGQAASKPVIDEVTDLVASHGKLEARLVHEEEFLSQVLDQIPTGIVMLDGENRVLVINSAARKFNKALGIPAVGETVRTIGPIDLADLEVHREDGLPHELTVSRFQNRNFLVETRELSEDIARKGMVLVISEVTRERQAQQRAEQQERLAAVGQLAAGIAHDFNNLLMGIMGFAELLSDDDVPEAAREDALRIVNMGERASQLVKQILDFSRTSEVERKPANLVPFLKESVKLLKRTLPENIKISADLGAVPHFVEVSLTQMQQVLTNLAVNASHAMKSGGELTLALLAVSSDSASPPAIPDLQQGRWLALSLADTGSGIPSEVQSKIFEPFFTTKPRGEGTGLGLSQVFGIVKQHGGFIELDSVVGTGTTFTVYLPEIDPTSEERADGIAETPLGGGETVLLVEDEETVREVVSRTLDHLGYQVIVACDGSEGLAVYREQKSRIQLILTDVVMPDLGGPEMVKIIRDEGSNTPVIFMSGYPLNMSPSQIRSLSPFWIQKPLNSSSLSPVVREALASCPMEVTPDDSTQAIQ